MVSYRLVATAGLLASAYALPLNINLGAYSPALVVGDGEISFGGAQDVSQLFSTLEGAAVSAAAGANAGTTAAAAPAAAPAAAAPKAAVAPATTPAAAVAAPAVASTSAETTPAAVSTAIDPNLQEQAASISTLQGMGKSVVTDKEISPREADVTEGSTVKRDLAGFDRALKYAEAALTKGPVIQLGTGVKGSDVGIIVDNRPAAAAAAGAAKAAKRDETSASQPRRRTKVTTMYVRRGVPLAMQQASENETRDVKPIAAVEGKRDTAAASSPSAIDSINLNVDDPHGITMTFVETSDDDDEE